ncbi:MAG: 6-phosphogluconate dehydrogenase, partial [Olpidium bornovanus]
LATPFSALGDEGTPREGSSAVNGGYRSKGWSEVTRRGSGGGLGECGRRCSFVFSEACPRIARKVKVAADANCASFRALNSLWQPFTNSSNCSTTAQRGALDWYRPFHKAVKPVFEELYAKVKDGSETARSLQKNSSPSYRRELEKELAELRDHEMWRAGATVRALRPENAAVDEAKGAEVEKQKISAASA